MKRLHLLILKSYFGPFVATFFIAIFVLLMQFLWKYIDDLVGKGIEINVLLELLFYASATFVPMALPLAILLSSLMTFGNLSENYELTALKSSGISLQRTMMPLIILSMLISIAAFIFSNNILPISNLKFSSLLYDIRHQRPDLNIQPGIFYKGIDNLVIKIDEKDYKTKMMYGLMVYDHSDKRGNVNVTVADSATMHITDDENYMILSMYTGSKYEELEEERKSLTDMTHPHQHSTFDKETMIIDLSGFGLKRTDEELFKDNEEMLNINQLNANIDTLKIEYEKKKENFGQNLLLSTYYKKENKIDSIKVVIDTIYEYDIDSIFNNLPIKEKRSILGMAKNYASSAQLYISSTIDEYDYRDRTILKHNIEWHRKFSLSFACLVLFFIGAPLGAIIKKGGLGMPVVVAVIFFIFYYVIMITGEKTAKEGVIPVYQGMWLSAFILLPLGIFLTSKATTDSVIFDTYTYRKFFANLLGIEKIRNIRLNKLVTNLDNATYTDAELLEKLNTLKSLTKAYQNDNLRRITFGMTIKDYFKVKDKDHLNAIYDLYREIYGILLQKSKEYKYFKEKLTEFPSHKMRKLKRSSLSKIFNIILVPFIPLWIINLLMYKYSLHSLRTRLKLMNNLANDIIIVVEEPEFLIMKN